MTHSHESLGWAELMRIDGRFDSETAGEVERVLLDLLATGAPALLMDVSQVTLLASAGLRTLLVVTKEAGKRGKAAVVVAPTATARRVLQVSRLDSVLVIAEDLEAAKDLASPGPPARGLPS